jgi:hypothetical protein
MLPETNQRNMKRLKSILDYFCLDDESSNYVWDLLDSNFKSDENWMKTSELLNLNNQHRAFYTVNMGECPDFDKGWEIFKKCMKAGRDVHRYGYGNSWLWSPGTVSWVSSFDGDKVACVKAAEWISDQYYQLNTYDTYRTGKIIINNQPAKLFRTLKRKGILTQNMMERITTIKNSKNIITLMVSRNPVDYLMCSTNQSFSSCIDLESDYEGAYYLGLPGFWADRSRFLLTILSDNKLRKYNTHDYDLKHFRYRNRTIGLVVRNLNSPDPEKLYTVDVNWYPYAVEKIAEKLGEFMGLPSVWDSEYPPEGFESYQKSKILRWQDHGMCQPYLDGWGVETDGNGEYSCHEDGSCGGFGDFSCTVGFNGINDIDDAMSSHMCMCEKCGDQYDEDELMWINDYPYCEYCVDRYFVSCECCSGWEWHADSVETCDDEWVCDYCAREYYKQCDECSRYTHNNSVTYVGDMILCDDCAEDFFECEECGKVFPSHDQHEHDFCEYCYSCWKEKIKESEDE